MIGALLFFKGTCTRGIYDNMKTAVDTIFVGRERAYNRRFAQMCSHYLIDPVASTPASGWGEPRVRHWSEHRRRADKLKIKLAWCASGSSRRGCG